MTTATEAPPAQTDALVERLFTATIDTLEMASVHIGGRLGFYRALADGGEATPAELAARTGTAERYVREWLEQQAVAGFLTSRTRATRARAATDCLPPTAPSSSTRRTSTSSPRSRRSRSECAGRWRRCSRPRTGGGVPFESYEIHDAIGEINRPQYVNLIADWLAAIPEVDARLRAQPPARVADLAAEPPGRASRSHAPTPS